MRILLVCVLSLSAFSSALRGAEESLRDKLKDIEVGDNWIYNDWAAAKVAAAKSKKPIFALFR